MGCNVRNNINNLNFKLLIYLYALYILSYIAFSIIAILGEWHINPLAIFEVKAILSIFIFILSIFCFINDHSFLKKTERHCPAWGWFFLLPMYVYMRQKYNDEGFEYFWIFISINIILPIFSDGLFKGLIMILFYN